MRRQFTKGIDLYEHQVKRFTATLKNMRDGHVELVREGLADGKELTKASGATGAERKKLLRRLGHPFGRGTSSATSTATGKLRGTTRARAARNGIKGQLPLLPIGTMSGRLHKSIGSKSITRGRGIQRFDVGPIHSPGPGLFRLRPQGTSKMVGSPYFSEVKRRWRPRNKALIDVVRAKQLSI